jgi:PST family polysaccharide transporter
MKKDRYNKDDYFLPNTYDDDLKKRALRSAGFSITAQIINTGTQTIGTILLARMLSPDTFGLITMVATLSLLLQNFGVNGFTESIIQEEQISHEQISKIFWINAGINLSLTLIFIAMSPVFAWFYKEPRVIPVTIGMSLTILFSGLSVQHLALMKRKMQFARTAANQVFGTIFSVIVGIFMAFSGFGVWALLGRRISLTFSITVGAWLLCCWKPGLPFNKEKVRHIIKFALNTYGNFCFLYFSRNIDKILIGWRYGSQNLGSYDRAYYLATIFHNQLNVPIAHVGVATLSRLKQDIKKCRDYYLKIISLISFIGMPVSCILTLAGSDIIDILLGPQWGAAGKTFSAFGPGIGVMLIYGTTGWLHYAMGRPDRLFRWSIFSTITTLSLLLIGLSYGPFFVAVAYSASYYVLFIPGVLYAGKPIDLRMNQLISAIWKNFLSALICGVIIYYSFYHSNQFNALLPFFRIMFVSISFAAIYAIVIYLLYRSFEPFQSFFSLLKDILSKRK